MSLSLTRLFEGVVATLRADVIPHVGDAYARGQAVGVIDLLGHIAGRVEWAREPLLQALQEKSRLLTRVAVDLNEPPPAFSQAPETLGSTELIAERARLDADICDAMTRAHARGDAAAREALALLIRHAHDEATAAMKWTRKPQFGEMVSGKREQAAPPPG